MKITLIKLWPNNANDYVFHIDLMADNGACMTPEVIRRDPYRNHPSDGFNGKMDSDELFLGKAIKRFDNYVEQQKQLKTKTPITIKEIEL